LIDGEKAIEDIKIGDWVLSDDPNTPGGIEYKQVLQTFSHDTTNPVDIFINGEKITTTDTHPFWVQDVGWVAARDLNAGTHLQTKDESWLSIDANGNRTEYKYDALDRQIEIKDARGGLTKTVYDKVGNTISITDALNHSTIFEYDALDRNVSITDALGHSTTSAFDAVGNLLTVTDTLGRKTGFAYDNLNRQISTPMTR
jgi:YD repeat-containing protein